MKKKVVVLAILLMAAVAVGCGGDTTKKIVILNGTVVIEPFKVYDGITPTAYYRLSFHTRGNYYVAVNVADRVILSFQHRVTSDPRSWTRIVKDSELSRVVASILVERDGDSIESIEYDMRTRGYDRDVDKLGLKEL